MERYQKISDNVSAYNMSKKDSTSLFSSPASKWVVTEKVHGANFSIRYVDGEYTFSKRNGILDHSEWFYNWQLIRNVLVKRVKQLAINLDHPDVVVYGELFGGWFPNDPSKWTGPDGVRLNSRGISTVPFDERAIQEGIYYSNSIEYMIFDVGLIKGCDGKSGMSNTKIEFVNYDVMEEMCKKSDALYSKPLFVGTFKEAQKYSLEFDSTIPAELNMESLPKGTNTAEGIVIKPMVNRMITVKNGPDVRCLIKIKHSKFLEVSDSFDMGEASRSYQFVLMQLVNQNRYQSVVSKFGQVTQENRSMVLNEYVDDVWADFYQNFSNVAIVDYDKANEYVIGISSSLIDDNCG